MDQHNNIDNDVVHNEMAHSQHGSFPGMSSQQLLHRQQQQQQQQQQALPFPNITFPVMPNQSPPQQRLLQLQALQQQKKQLHHQQQQQEQQRQQQQQQLSRLQGQQQLRQQVQQPYQPHHAQQQHPQQRNPQLHSQHNTHLQQQQLQQPPQLQQHQLQRQSSSSSIASIPSITSIPSIPGMHIMTPQASPTKLVLMAPSEFPNVAIPGAPTISFESVGENTTAPKEEYVQPSSPPLSQEEKQNLLARCNRTDRTIWAAHQLLGGVAVNGFLRSTATAQRIKKQRARQVQWKKKDGHDEQEQEEDLKQQTMNPRTAKKLKLELTSGLLFCRQLHNVVRGLLAEMEPTYHVPPLEGQSLLLVPSSSIIASPLASTKLPIPTFPLSPGTAQSKRPSVKSVTAAPKVPISHPTSNPGDPTGSSLRKTRKRKWSMDITPKLPDHYAKLPKKEQAWRLYSILRFRALQSGDYVAARVSSRDLWILARVVLAYPDSGLDVKEFLVLTDAKRDALFKDKVVIKDVEEKDEAGTNQYVHRNLVLPLPRSYGEAAEWNTRIKKGSRVYAMYPKTTALYSATVIDSTTFCRGDDDIVVVEFDGDDQDESGNLPKYHIPARFVTLIPREFPASNNTSKKKRTIEPIKRNVKKHKREGSSDSALNEMISEMAYGDNPNSDLDLDQFDLDL